jgi:hypothetical protein
VKTVEDSIKLPYRTKSERKKRILREKDFEAGRDS